MNETIRVRFAPSPTGPLHIGGVRTALYNYLFAKKNNGTFILRIEDTDQLRFVPGAEEYIIESLDWLGITPDEGIVQGGAYGPYRQSDRKAIYRQYALQLVEKGYAYYAFDTAEELDDMRKRLEQQKSSSQQYGCQTRMMMKNSLSLPESEWKARIEAGEPYVIRIKIPEGEKVVVNDLIRGRVEVDSEQLDDKVLFKSDGMPTYHLANVVDDYLMKISHVIRGEEWLPSAPLHVLLYRYLGWEESMPQFAHLPLLLKPDGNGKLSKRDGDRLGFPVFPLQWTDPSTGEQSSGYRETGYFPEAVLNILAFLGWNPGTEKELFSKEELIEAFSLERINKAGAKFDLEKAKWFNQQYLRLKPTSELAKSLIPLYQSHYNILPEQTKLETVIDLVKERAVFTKDLLGLTSFFFVAPQSYDAETIKKKWKPETPQLLQKISQIITETEPFDVHICEENIKKWLAENAIPLGNAMIPLRLCLVGGSFGPDLFKIIELLGKEEVLSRIKSGIEKIN